MEYISFASMNAGINNQKLALFGLIVMAIQNKKGIRFPSVVNFEPDNVHNDYNRAYPLKSIFDFVELKNLLEIFEIRFTDIDIAELVNPWECFGLGTSRIAQVGDQPDSSTPNIAIEFFKRLRPSSEITALIHTASLQMQTDGVQVAAQLRIEKDWLKYSDQTLAVRITRREDYNISYLEILQKIKNTPVFREIDTLYVSVDEDELPIPFSKIVKTASEALKIIVKSKRDYVPNINDDRNRIIKSLIDFELSIVPRRFVGLSRSTFSNVVAFTRYSRKWPNKPFDDSDFIYNAPVDQVLPRSDFGTRVEPIDVVAPHVANWD